MVGYSLAAFLCFRGCGGAYCPFFYIQWGYLSVMPLYTTLFMGLGPINRFWPPCPSFQTIRCTRLCWQAPCPLFMSCGGSWLGGCWLGYGLPIVGPLGCLCWSRASLFGGCWGAPSFFWGDGVFKASISYPTLLPGSSGLV